MDSLIDVLDAYGPTLEEEASKSSEPASDKSEVSITKAKELDSYLDKLAAISTYVRKAAVTKLHEHQLRGPTHIVIAQNMWDLVGYTATTLHLDDLGNVAATNAEVLQRALFDKAAAATTNLRTFVEARPNLVALENAMRPALENTKSTAEATVIRVLATVHAGTELTSHFFANRIANFEQISTDAVQHATKLVTNFRASHPNLEPYIQGLVTSLQQRFAQLRDLYLQVAEVPKDRLYTVISTMYSLFNQLYASVLTFRDQIVDSAKKDVELLEPSAPKDESESKGDASQEPEPAEDSSAQNGSDNNNNHHNNNNNNKSKRRGSRR